MALREFAAQELWRIMGFDEVDEIMLTTAVSTRSCSLSEAASSRKTHGEFFSSKCVHMCIFRSVCLWGTPISESFTGQQRAEGGENKGLYLNVNDPGGTHPQ